jgi:hypothetical protein
MVGVPYRLSAPFSQTHSFTVQTFFLKSATIVARHCSSWVRTTHGFVLRLFGGPDSIRRVVRVEVSVRLRLRSFYCWLATSG